VLDFVLYYTPIGSPDSNECLTLKGQGKSSKKSFVPGAIFFASVLLSLILLEAEALSRGITKKIEKLAYEKNP
jgi:hypothetical protein